MGTRYRIVAAILSVIATVEHGAAQEPMPLGPAFDAADADDFSGYPKVGGSEAGFVVTWRGPDDEVFAKRFDATGTPLGDGFIVSTDSDGDKAPVGVDATGSFVVSWQSYDSGIFAQPFDATGAPQGTPLLVNPEEYDYG